MVLLQGIPGAPELLVILLIVVLLTVPVLLAIAAGTVYFAFVRETDEDDEPAVEGPPEAPASGARNRGEPDDEAAEERTDR